MLLQICTDYKSACGCKQSQHSCSRVNNASVNDALAVRVFDTAVSCSVSTRSQCQCTVDAWIVAALAPGLCTGLA